MITATRIPKLAGTSREAALAWWDALISLGINTHLDDDPAEIVMLDSGKRALDDAACQKVLGVYNEMFSVFGDEAYEIGLTAYMKFLGFKKNTDATPGKDHSFWVPSTK